MLRKFKISIDGTEYFVEMEEIGGASQPAPVQAAPVQAAPQPEAPAPQPVAPAAPTPKPAAASSGKTLAAPMPGTILKILVGVGDSVEENQPLMILEAMKMENEIVADHSGVITDIFTTSGATVNPGDPLLAIG